MSGSGDDDNKSKRRFSRIAVPSVKSLTGVFTNSKPNSGDVEAKVIQGEKAIKNLQKQVAQKRSNLDDLIRAEQEKRLVDQLSEKAANARKAAADVAENSKVEGQSLLRINHSAQALGEEIERLTRAHEELVAREEMRINTSIEQVEKLDNLLQLASEAELRARNQLADFRRGFSRRTTTAQSGTHTNAPMLSQQRQQQQQGYYTEEDFDAPIAPQQRVAPPPPPLLTTQRRVAPLPPALPPAPPTPPAFMPGPVEGLGRVARGNNGEMTLIIEDDNSPGMYHNLNIVNSHRDQSITVTTLDGTDIYKYVKHRDGHWSTEDVDYVPRRPGPGGRI